MLRLTANKTKLYTLVAHYVDNLPPMRSGTEFIKYPRRTDYALNWITKEWNTAHAFFSTCMGRPLLSIEIRDGETGKTVSRTTHTLTIQDLRERGMVEEFVTAAERRRIERSADNGGLSPATRSAVFCDLRGSTVGIPPARDHGKEPRHGAETVPNNDHHGYMQFASAENLRGGGQPVFYGQLSQTLQRGSGCWRHGGFSTRPRPLCG